MPAIHWLLTLLRCPLVYPNRWWLSVYRVRSDGSIWRATYARMDSKILGINLEKHASLIIVSSRLMRPMALSTSIYCTQLMQSLSIFSPHIDQPIGWPVFVQSDNPRKNCSELVIVVDHPSHMSSVNQNDGRSRKTQNVIEKVRWTIHICTSRRRNRAT